jgi:hypothetical protein
MISFLVILKAGTILRTWSMENAINSEKSIKTDLTYV